MWKQYIWNNIRGDYVADRKSEILDGARKLIREYGYDGFSYQDLSAMIGITKASIHYHFPSKEVLGIAVLDSIYEELNYTRQVLKSIDSAELKLQTFINAYLGIVDIKLICPISSMHVSWNRVPVKLKTRLKEVTAFEIEKLKEVIEFGQKQGVFKQDSSAEIQAITILATLKGAIQYSRALEKGYEEKIVKNLINQLIYI